MAKYHFTGIAGIGMSALAQLYAMQGDIVTGSDRLLDNKLDNLPVWENLRNLGIKLFAQDASGVTKDLDYVVLTSAIEDGNADYLKAKELGIKILHRSELLAKQVANYKTVAVSGTCGKSTVTAMIYEIFEFAGKSPSVITGGQILGLMAGGLYGNVKKGTSDYLIIEADESDGSFLNYRPETGIMLNLSKDHKEMDVLEDYFRKFKAGCKKFIVNADEKNLAPFGQDALTFGINGGKIKAENVKLFPKHSEFSVNGVKFTLPMTGLHNVSNALAAVAACVAEGISLDDCSKALLTFSGVYRRFNIVGEENRVIVIDDFAHNPEKIAAALKAAQLMGNKVFAHYQPHGYAPVKLLKSELISAITAALRADDEIYFSDIYYAGGTADRSVSSKDLADGIFASGKKAYYVPTRHDVLLKLSRDAKPGDVIISMGARDPALNAFAKEIYSALKKQPCSCGCCNN